MEQCKKCERGLSHPNAYNHVRLVGGYSTILCEPCRNAFHEFFITTDERKILRSEKASQKLVELAAQAGHAPTREHVAALAMNQADIDDQCYRISKAWVEGNEDVTSPGGE